MSEQHAELRREAGRVYLSVLDPGAITRVNGRAVLGEQALAPGDVVRLGDTLLLLTFVGGEPNARQEEEQGACAGRGMYAVRRSIDIVAQHKHTVVVTGETGTGKEVVARTIHQRSHRPGPFIAVNCAMLSESLLASELFGHVRGAFTGATADQQGLFRAANNGTLLLDEMSDMPLSLQASLLRVLETGTVRPVGSTRDLPVNTRIVATSHRELIDLVHQEKFRADLYARLAQWTIRLPPLKERREDIPCLARFLLARFEGPRRRFSPDLAEALLTHDWPLNVRGLLNTLSIAVIASPPGGALELTEEVQLALWTSRSVQAEAVVQRVSVGKDDIMQAMSQCEGRVASVARMLGLSRPRLYRLFAQHGIEPGQFRGR